MFQTDVGTVFLARCFCVHVRGGRCAGAGCRPQSWGFSVGLKEMRHSKGCHFLFRVFHTYLHTCMYACTYNTHTCTHTCTHTHTRTHAHYIDTHTHTQHTHTYTHTPPFCIQCLSFNICQANTLYWLYKYLCTIPLIRMSLHARMSEC